MARNIAEWLGKKSIVLSSLNKQIEKMSRHSGFVSIVAKLMMVRTQVSRITAIADFHAVSLADLDGNLRKIQEDISSNESVDDVTSSELELLVTAVRSLTPDSFEQFVDAEQTAVIAPANTPVLHLFEREFNAAVRRNTEARLDSQTPLTTVVPVAVVASAANDYDDDDDEKCCDPFRAIKFFFGM